MLALLSPAKTLDYSTSHAPIEPTTPHFADDAERIARGAARLGATRLQSLMKISPALATLNAARFRGFADAEERAAIHAFAGDVYTGFDVASLDRAALDFAQDHLRILSGLYGVLRPSDAIRPYRLEMGTRWAPGRAADLYDYWGTRVADRIATDLAATGSDTIVNLASQEYWHVAKDRLPGAVRVLEIDFREAGPDGPRFVSFHAKRARGAMARWICEHRVVDRTGLAGFDADGYRLADESDTSLSFVRG